MLAVFGDRGKTDSFLQFLVIHVSAQFWAYTIHILKKNKHNNNDSDIKNKDRNKKKPTQINVKA